MTSMPKDWIILSLKSESSDVLSENEFEQKLGGNLNKTPHCKLVVLQHSHIIYDQRLFWIFKRLRRYPFHIAVIVPDLHHSRNKDIRNVNMARDIMSQWDVDSFWVLFNRDKIPFLKEKLKSVFWCVPSRPMPSVDTTALVPWEERSNTSYFFGYLDPKRLELLRKISGNVSTVWEQTFPRMASKAIGFSSRYQVCLNIARDRDFNYRNSEVLEARSLLISDSSQDGLDSVMTPFKHYVPWDKPEDLIEKINYYLAHSEEAKTIAEQGHLHWKENFSHPKGLHYLYDHLILGEPLPLFLSC